MDCGATFNFVGNVLPKSRACVKDYIILAFE